MQRGPLTSRILVLTVSCAVGVLYGYGISQIPSPHTPGVFWVSNLAGPWLLLPFCAGWWQGSLTASALTGALCDIGATAGFYGQFLLVDNRQGPQLRPTALPTVLEHNIGNWLAFVAPWVLLAVIAGPVCGAMGSWTRTRTAALPGIALGLALCAEPIVWSLPLGYQVAPWIWAPEVLCGVGILAATGLRRARPRPRHTSATAGTGISAHIRTGD